MCDCATPAAGPAAWFWFGTPTGATLSATFDGGRLTSDGGLPWVARADAALGLCEALAAAGYDGYNLHKISSKCGIFAEADSNTLVKSGVPVDEIIAAIRASAEGELEGIAPTGKRVVAQQSHWFRVVDGKLAEHWAVRDDLSMLQQLGIMPDPGQPGETEPT